MYLIYSPIRYLSPYNITINLVSKHLKHWEKREKRKNYQSLNTHFPDPGVPLDHEDAYTLLIMLLSAQCTDERVNQVTPALFKKASNPKNE